MGTHTGVNTVCTDMLLYISYRGINRVCVEWEVKPCSLGQAHNIISSYHSFLERTDAVLMIGGPVPSSLRRRNSLVLVMRPGLSAVSGVASLDGVSEEVDMAREIVEFVGVGVLQTVQLVVESLYQLAD